MMSLEEKITHMLMAVEDGEIRLDAYCILKELLVSKFGNLKSGFEAISKIEVPAIVHTPTPKKLSRNDKKLVDTIEIIGNGYLSLEDRNINGIMENKVSNYTTNDGDMRYRCAIRVGNHNGSLGSYNDAIRKIEGFKNAGGVETMILNRVDIATDLQEYDLNNDYKILKTLVELYKVKSGAKKVLSTRIGSSSVGNIKSTSDKAKSCLTIYSNDDKVNRAQGVRIEYRKSDLRGKDYNSNLKIARSKYNEILKSVVDDFDILIKSVEIRVAKELKKEYDALLKKGEIKTFTDFVVNSNKEILTEGILLELYRHSGLKGNCKTWKKKYSKTRTLDLIKKTEIKNLIKKLNK